MTLLNSKNIFFIGINGSGMRALAYLLAAQGKKISGTDKNIDDFKKEWITRSDASSRPKGRGQVMTEKENEAGPLLEKADLMIYSDAVKEDHPLRQQAVKLGKTTVSYAQAVGVFAQGFKNIIAVAGTHGKSSTTAMLAHMFIEAGVNPTVLVGASVPQWGNQNAYAGGREYFIVEADEYREHFLTLHPTHAIITNIEWDHPDYFQSEEEVKKAFEKFQDSVKKLIVTPQTQRPSGRDEASSSPAAQNDNTFTLSLPGEHMKSNARLAATMAANVLGISQEQALNYLASFQGLSRRFELIGQIGGKDIYSDYGHHPTEIAATLKAAQAKFPDKKILVVIEIHTTERLHALWPAFISALSAAPGVVVVPIFRPTGRNLQALNNSLEVQLQEALQMHTKVWLAPTYADLKLTLTQAVANYDMALAFTAGDLDGKLRSLV